MNKLLSKKVRRLLIDQNWEDSIPRLTRYAIIKIREKYWYGGKGGNVAAGKMAKDFVLDAISKVFSGERGWNPDKEPDLLGYLAGVLRSDISHSSTSFENRNTTFSEDIPHAVDEEAVSEFRKGIHKIRNLGSDFIPSFIKYIGNKEQLIKFVNYILDGLKPREIADKMNLSRNDIYNLRKVIKRRLGEFLTARDDIVNTGVRNE